MTSSINYNHAGQHCYQCDKEIYGEGIIARPVGIPVHEKGFTSYHSSCFERANEIHKLHSHDYTHLKTTVQRFMYIVFGKDGMPEDYEEGRQGKQIYWIYKKLLKELSRNE